MVLSILCALVAIVGVVAWKSRVATQSIRERVAQTCGVPLSIVGWPHTEDIDGQEPVVVDVDARTLHIPATRAFAVVHRQPDYVDCRLSGPAP